MSWEAISNRDRAAAGDPYLRPTIYSGRPAVFVSAAARKALGFGPLSSVSRSIVVETSKHDRRCFRLRPFVPALDDTRTVFQLQCKGRLNCLALQLALQGERVDLVVDKEGLTGTAAAAIVDAVRPISDISPRFDALRDGRLSRRTRPPTARIRARGRVR